jgi:cytochrome c-type biogenesis protein CcmH
MKRLWFLPFLLLVLALVAGSPASAQDSFPSDDDVNRVAKKLYCPVCPNTPLDVCETQACKDWREEIRVQLSAGWSEAEVTSYFVERYGERVLAEPERGGFTSLVWILPVVAFVAGLAIVVQVLRSWRARRQQAASAALPTESARIAPEVRARIERELQELL